MAHRYNDIVTLVRAGFEVPALVVQSSPQPDGEHLTVLSLDPEKASPLLSGMNVDAAIRRDFVSPLTDGRTFGWKEKAEEEPQAVSDEPQLPAPPPLSDDEVYTQVRNKFLETEEIHPPDGSTVDQVFRAAARLAMTTVRTLQDVGEENKLLHAKIAEGEKASDAAAQLDEAQGPVSPGDPESPHAPEQPAEPPSDAPTEPPAEPQS